MLQAHSLLWHYLWLAPNLLLLGLGVLLWKRNFQAQFPIFVAFSILGALEQLALYVSDVLPAVSAETWWLIFWTGIVLEGLLKFALVGEIFARVFDPYPSLAKLGKILIQVVGSLLIVSAAMAAAYAPNDSNFGIISGAHLLEQTIFLIESGLLLFIFVFSAYFHLTFERKVFGIAIGLAISACVHLGTWAVLANAGLPDTQRTIFDLINMATYHVCILIWFYYFFFPATVSDRSVLPITENSLDLWNRELERLLQ